MYGTVDVMKSKTEKTGDYCRKESNRLNTCEQVD